jgi:Reverse transcriptase (RNA-dependent DNA polymerase)
MEAHGEVIFVRFTDDFVAGFEHREQAERFLAELGERLAKFGLELHADKTRIVEFGRYAAANRRDRGDGKPETFNFLGFTHSCGKTRKGHFTIEKVSSGSGVLGSLHRSHMPANAMVNSSMRRQRAASISRPTFAIRRCVSRHQTSASFDGFSECGSRSDSLSFRVNRGVADLRILRPVGNQTPAHEDDLALPDVAVEANDWLKSLGSDVVARPELGRIVDDGQCRGL